MKVFYLKGLSTTKEEFEYIKDKFSYMDVELVSLVDNYADISKFSKEKIIEYLRGKISESGEKNINLICHSMGCNFGLMLANRLGGINSITFISPEFKDVTQEERDKIIPSSRPTTKEPSVMPMSFDKMKSILLFAKSKKWIIEDIHDFMHADINTSIIYSKGDKFVSRKVIHALSDSDNISEYEVDTNNHNPLLEDVGCMNIISDTLKNEIYKAK